VRGKFLLIVTALCLCLAFAACGVNTPSQGQVTTSPQEQVTTNPEEQITTETQDASAAYLPDGITPNILKADLLTRLDLIPIEGVLGGTPYYVEDTFEILSLEDRRVSITAEDGHNGATLILTYEIDEDNNIEWEFVEIISD